MIQQQLDNATEFNPSVKRYALTDSQGSTEVVFFPQALAPSGATLAYRVLTLKGVAQAVVITPAIK